MMKRITGWFEMHRLSRCKACKKLRWEYQYCFLTEYCLNCIHIHDEVQEHLMKHSNRYAGKSYRQMVGELAEYFKVAE